MLTQPLWLSVKFDFGSARSSSMFPWQVIACLRSWFLGGCLRSRVWFLDCYWVGSFGLNHLAFSVLNPPNSSKLFAGGSLQQPKVSQAFLDPVAPAQRIDRSCDLGTALNGALFKGH